MSTVLDILLGRAKSCALVPAWRFDKDGYLIGGVSVQEHPNHPGEFMVPDDCTRIDPKAEDGFFSRFVDGAWEKEKIPTTAADFVGRAPVTHYHQTAHEAFLVSLMQDLCKDSTTHRIERGDDLSWSVVEIPQPTEEEKELEAAKNEIRNLQYKLSSTDWVCAKIVDATYREGEDKAAEVAAQYTEVLNERETYRQKINEIEAKYGLTDQDI